MAKVNEDKLLDMVNDLDDADGSSYGDGPEDEDTDDNDEQDAGDEDTDADGDEADGDSDGDSDDSDNPDLAARDARGNQQQDAPDIKGLRPVPGGLFQDVKGNLVDAKGNILARAGSERRLFERSQRQGAVLSEQQNTIQQLTQERDQLNRMIDQPRALGLDMNDLAVGYPIISEFKKNPVEAAKKIVEMVLGMGHNLNEILGQDAGSSVEMSAIQRMLDQRLAPLNQIEEQRTARIKEQENARAAEAAITRFVDEHENAGIHLEAIDNLIGRNRGMTPERAYFEIRGFAQKHGLDFSKPLAPQIEAVARAQNREQPQRRQSPRNIAMPNGRGRPSVQTMQQGESASATDSWGDIIQRAIGAK